MVEGFLEQTDEFKATGSSAGEISQGTEGSDLVIRKCSCWLAGPAVRPADELLDWLGRNAKDPDGKRRRFRLPVVVSFEDPHRVTLGSAFVGVSLESSGHDALTLDDGALGISLLERLGELCPEKRASCALWLEGYWGPLVEGLPGGNRSGERRTFAVLKVLTLVSQAMGRDVKAFVEIP